MGWALLLGGSMAQLTIAATPSVSSAIEFPMLNRVLLIGLIAGLVAGSAAALVQVRVVQPLIVVAEEAEVAQLHAQHIHSHHGHEDVHTHDDIEEPSDNPETRKWSTAIAVVCTAIGYGLMASSVMFFLKVKGLKGGLILGGLGFLSIQLMPALGVAPQPPGTPSCDVHTRQLWWAFAAFSTVAASSLAFQSIRLRKASFGAAAAVLMLLPHLVRPWLDGMGPIPRFEELSTPFVLASAAMTATLWFLLGTVSGLLHARIPDGR